MLIGLIQKSKTLLCLLAVILLHTAAARAQDTTTADGLYEAARKAAFDEKDFSGAIRLCKKALVTAPAYTDIVIFTGRLYTWQKQPDSARRYLQSALKQAPTSEDAYSALTDLEFWNKNNDSALSVVNRGTAIYPASPELLIRKAKVLSELKQYKEALVVIDTLLAIDNGNAEARALGYTIRDYSSKNKIGIRYDHAYFDKQFPDPWDMVSIEYVRMTKAGPFIGRINYANRFKMSGLQYEVEAYPHISRTFYGFINLGFSDTTGIFPRWSGGASLFANLPAAFEAEAGIRYLYFTKGIVIYTANVGKYYKSFQFGLRTYLVPTLNVSQAYIAQVRYYFGNADDYVNLSGGWGIAPDDSRVNVQLNSSYQLRSNTAELRVSHAFRKLHVFSINAFLLNQEFRPSVTGNQVQFGIGYTRHF
jgi:YaiO family outer membrane protein